MGDGEWKTFCPMTRQHKKRSVWVCALVCLMQALSIATMHAQLVTGEQLMEMKKRQFPTGTWSQIAAGIGSHIQLSADKAIVYSKVIEIPGKSREELYAAASAWATDNFQGSACDIRMMDSNRGTIIVQGAVLDIFEHVGMQNVYTVSLKPVLRIDVKDGRARIVFTLSHYNVYRLVKSGRLFEESQRNEEVWSVAQCYPFIRSDTHENASSKALVVTHLCAVTWLKAVEHIAKEGYAPTDNDW